MRDLLILGGGVHGAEMAEIVARVNEVAPTWNLLGFLTPDAPGINQSRNGHTWLGAHGDLPTYPGAFLVPDNEWPRSMFPLSDSSR